MPHENEYEIEEVIKGCFNGGSTVYDHFVRFENNGILRKQEFGAAINSLGCSWPSQRNVDIFSKFDQAINGKQTGQVTALNLDTHIHFSSKKTL